jgi:hypothetical protein
MKEMRMHSKDLALALFVVSFGLSACNGSSPGVEVDDQIGGDPTDSGVDVESGSADEIQNTGLDSIPTTEIGASLIAPEELTYLGAFRLPGESGGSSWEYSGYAMAFYPEGDPSGPGDGFPGSLFAIGHDHQQYVSEINIPAPVISTNKNLEDLNTASTLQPFSDITSGMFGYLEIPRAGLEILPPQGDQDGWQLYFSWGQHFEDAWAPTHGWVGLDLSSPQPSGPWHVSGFSNYVTNDYLFEIPQDWSDSHVPGMRLATGRFRDGHWGGLGPSLLAFGPWLDGNPPTSNSSLEHVTPLILYGRQQAGAVELDIAGIEPMMTFSPSDEWSGGAWLTSGERSAVIFVGTKALGDSWYGFANGVVYPISGDPNEVYPDVPAWPYDSRGWWSDDISAQILFYDPADLAAVAQGEKESWEPQPYASLAIDPNFFDPGFDHEIAKRYLVGAAAFDREHGLLYIVERQVDDGKSLVHVFTISN